MNMNKLNNSIEFRKKDFFYPLILLLLYSLISAIYKIMDNQLMMAMNIPILLLLFKQRNKSSNDHFFLQGHDFVFLFFLFYLAFQSIVTLLNPQTNLTGLMIGFFLDIIPFMGFFYSRKINFDLWIKVILIIAVIHLIFGIVSYPPFGLNGLLGPMADLFRDQIAFGRMSSVSGSLAFGNLMMYACIIAFFYKKWLLPFLLIGLIFSAQRSSWIGFVFCILLYLFQVFRDGSFKKIISTLVTIIFSFYIIVITANFFAIDFEFLDSRLSRLSEAGGERTGQWLNGLNNFSINPIGAGIGQVGQVAARFTKDNTYLWVADGDYFRIMSEYGLGGVFFFCFFFLSFFMIIVFTSLKSKKEMTVISLVGASFIQMIGSNIGEFFFNNFIYWTIIGFFFSILNTKKLNVINRL